MKGNGPPHRIQIQRVAPQVDGGSHAVKSTVGDPLEVSADVFRDGHELLGAAVRYRPAGERQWRETLMREEGNDRWTATFVPDRCGAWEFAVEAWVDRFASFRDELQRKFEAGQNDLSGELSEGAALFGVESLTVEDALAGTEADRSERIASSVYPVDVDVLRVRFGSWYELFPRSWGGFSGVERVLPELAELGFDVVYLPPVHPIGHTNRKGKNNAATAGPDDPGSPWAIGSEDGGHTAVNSELGTLEDFDRLTARARELGIDVALDFAIQCSPDHPWLKEHPEWFHRRPDGTLKYAENPPKKYQDIYNVNFDCEDWRGLWQALHDVVRFWIGHGVRVFRVDNPHTKPVPFWEWLIAEIRRSDPDVFFLAEAFTRPAMMRTLAKVGFNQSYTYFTWKNTKSELLEFMQEVLEWSPFYRPNLFANTQDILHRYLQEGGRPAFEARLVLAATLSPTYGIYSGFEHCENVPLEEGSEEYVDSEKYEVKQRRLDGPLLPLAQRLNTIRRENPALQRVDNVAFLETENDHLFAYAKRQDDNEVLVVANLDAFETREGVVVVRGDGGRPPAFTVRDLLSGDVYPWRSGPNDVRLDPGRSYVFRVER
ncbi:MAG TPA: alpha-1,4-glucan--maltose-1-phosphate maltosyltransferase [Gaiellaceae bacterium]|nr:alpha-1,4-glucan--maltose-1-phosphate maltosyltransferase [Gaiellaceae bacterium]